MKKFYIDYIDTDGDLTHVWVMARDKDDAKEVVEHEYWNIDYIVKIY